MEQYKQQAENVSFTEKLNFLLTLLEDGEIEEAEAYDILIEHGKPNHISPQERPKGQIFEF